MKPGEQFGILEPSGSEFNDRASIDLIIVPGIAFDQNNYRMGRGRGYYDKLLETTKAVRMGVCFNFQYLENIPVEMHDLPMDLVIKA
jgi:5-formyltetrahydrofolate cyclo-ligase